MHFLLPLACHTFSNQNFFLTIIEFYLFLLPNLDVMFWWLNEEQAMSGAMLRKHSADRRLTTSFFFHLLLLTRLLCGWCSHSTEKFNRLNQAYGDTVKGRTLLIAFLSVLQLIKAQELLMEELTTLWLQGSLQDLCFISSCCTNNIKIKICSFT